MWYIIVNEILDQIGILAPTLVLWLGFLGGIGHAFEPDHIAAVGTLISKSKFKQKSPMKLLKESFTKSSVLGIFWGAGHTTSLVFVGFLVYVLAITIQEQVFSGIELAVGMMLVLLGVTSILNKKIKFKHRHPHEHNDGTIHFDEHEHSDSNHRHGHKSYLIGIVHGMAGSGSLVVITAMTMGNISMVLEFIAIFGIGSMVGMALIGSLMGIPFVFGNKISVFQKAFRYVAGTLSIVIGLNIMYQIGILENFRF